VQRYEHRPLLLLIESYALDVIGELGDEQRSSLSSIAAKVWKAGSSDWRTELRNQLGWAQTIDTTIVANWRAYRNAARAQRKPVSPREFAQMFGDAIWRASQDP
jgi:hypothetical protein